VTWCEDFRRGRLGIAKNQGQINGVVPLEGRWVVFEGDSANYIEYPPILTPGSTELTIGCWVKDLVDTGTNAVFLSQYHSGAAPNRSLSLEYDGTQLRFVAHLNGAVNSATGIVADLLTTKHFIVGRWSSGNSMDLLVDGGLEFSSGAIPGAMTGSIQPLRIGDWVSANRPLHGKISEPFILLGRSMSEEEIRYLFRRSTFH
jgi:hypothetical protein